MTLRILMTLDAVGGVWRYAMDLGAALVAEGHSLVFAGLGPAPTIAQREEAEAIGTLEWGSAPLDWMAEGPEELAQVPAWLESLTRSYRPDLLHLNLPSQAAGRRGGPPVVTVLHSCLASWFRVMKDTELPDHLMWQARLTLEGLRNADRIVVPSAAHAELTEAAYGLSGIEVVHNSSSSPLSRPSNGDGSIVAAGRWWDKAKNAEVVDGAAALMGSRVTLLGSCDGPGGQCWTPKHASVTGLLPYPEVMKRISAASLFISPSLYEPFGLATLEAARAARPLLLADIPIFTELWAGAARFFDPHDCHSLAEVAEELMQAPQLRRSLGASAQRRALTFSRERQAKAMTHIYRETAGAAMSMTP